MKKANTAQKKWMSDIAQWAEDNIHLMYIGVNARQKPFQLHHVVGRSAKHNKVDIGHWFILPIPFDLHDVSSNHPLNVTHHKRKFTNKFGFQRDIFNEMVEDMGMAGYELPPTEVCEAIRGTSA